MYRETSRLGNRLAPQRDDMEARRDMEEERRRARERAMMKRLSNKSATSYGSM